MDRPATESLNSCDREPIHIPGSIQPYGIMLISDRTGIVVGEAGTSENVLGRSLSDLIGQEVRSIISRLPSSGVLALGEASYAGTPMDAVAYSSGEHLVVELIAKAAEDRLDAAFLARIEALGATLERATSLADLARQAARMFQELTGYGRVMIYRFVDDDAGVVLGESISDDSSSFLHHHFPASDIPRQARALYVRNKVRVIADVHYVPAPVISASTDLSAIDMSDSTLRSVSPVHIQYLKNMGVGASASMSIVDEGALWGLVACHHHEPRRLSLTTRLACQALASTLARQVRARDQNELYRERMRLRTQEDAILGRLGPDGALTKFFRRSGADLANLLSADGFAAVQGGELFRAGICPDDIDVRAIAEHVRHEAAVAPVVTSSLATEMKGAEAFQETASGLLAVTMSTEVPTIMMWFRAEHLQTVEWAGNPHKDVEHSPDAVLMPRSSFEAWSESVSGRSRQWTHAEIESASRVVKLMLEARNNIRMRDLNRELTTSLKENEILLEQKEYLLKEVNHRVQNSLSLVAGFLRMQSRNASPEVRDQLEQAEHRLTAVGLVHRRLYQDDSVRVIDLSRYLAELTAELLTTLDADWQNQIGTEFAPILISVDRAVSVGLIVNELVTNASKYAYDGRPGPLNIRLEQYRDMLRVVVADQGRGDSGKTEGTGFGSRMLSALVQGLGGDMTSEGNDPGMKITIIAPIMDAKVRPPEDHPRDRA